MKCRFVAIFLFIVSQITFAQSPVQTIKGRVIDKETQAALIGATVKIMNSEKGEVTDENGYFKIDEVPIGRVSIRISYLGYEEVVMDNMPLSSGKELVLNVEMEEKVLEANEVVITASQDKTGTNNDMATVSARQFTIEETQRYAGSHNDPARMVANFAGVQGTNDAVNDIVIRGNSPYELLWRLEGVDIPNPNHFGDFGATGGPISMLNNNVLANSDFFTSAFPADYGNAISGVFDLRMRNGNDEHHEFLGQIGLNGFEAGAEGPLSRSNHSSYLINYRYSTLSLFKALGINFGTGTAIPYYQDLNFKLNFPSDKIGRITLFGLAGADHLDLTADDLGDDNLYVDRRINYSGKDRSAVAGISHTYLTGKNSYTKLILAYTYFYTGEDVDSLSVVNDAPHDFYNTNFDEGKFFASFYFNEKISVKHVLRIGAYGTYSSFVIADSIYRSSSNTFQTLSHYNGGLSLIQPYINWQFRPSEKFTFNIGLHAMWLTYNNSFSLEPRLGLKFQISEQQSLSAGYGLHSFMAPVYDYFKTATASDGSLIYPNENLDFMKSHEGVLGYDYVFSKTLRLKLETYYQYLFNVVVQKNPGSFSIVNAGGIATSGTPDSLSNEGTGRNFGAELTFEKFLDHEFYFLFTASAFDSKYKGSDDILRNTAWNSHYITNFLIGKDFSLNKNKQAKHLSWITADFKIVYGGGRNHTPVDVPASLIAGETQYIDSLAYSEHFPDYFRVDGRLGFRLHGKKIAQEWVIDVQNITNRKNPLYERVNLSTGQVQTVNQLGIFPVAQYRIEF